MSQTEEENKVTGNVPGPGGTTNGGAASDHAPTSPNPGDKPKTMEVPVDKMQAIMDQLDALQKRDAERDEEMAILRESVSQGKLGEAEDKRKPKGPPQAKLMIHNGKIVTSWKLVKNELIYDVRNLTAPVSEDLQIRVKYMDGSDSGPIRYVEFVRSKERVDVSKVGENGIMWVVKFNDPNISLEPLEVDPQFLNP